MISHTNLTNQTHGKKKKQPDCEYKLNETKKAFIKQGGIKINHILPPRIQLTGKNLLHSNIRVT